MNDKAYAVFLSFNSEDRTAVEQIAIYLNDRAKLHPWLDQWELIPGEPWVRNLERGLAASATCAVFVGQSGEGPWQQREVETALRQQVNSSDFRVIPVLLPNASKQPELPMFLSGNMWVDFRGKTLDDDDTLWRLECGIRGRSPGRGRKYVRTRKRQNPPSLEIPNPFGDAGRISDVTRFFDREELLRQIFEALRKGSNVSLVGESQVGKSSLLSMICALGSEKLGLPPESFVYFSLQEITPDDHDFYEMLCMKLGIELCQGGKLTRALRNKPYVLCLDEMDKMTWTGFTRQVRDHLRGLAETTSLRLVIASHAPLDRLFADSPEVTSPLASVCQPLAVKPFAPDVARQFLQERLAVTGVAFTPAQMNEIIRKTGGHPAKLQNEAAQLYRALSGK